jgi:hypothetical protein
MNESQCRSFLKTVGVLMLVGLPWVLLRAASATPEPKVVRATRFVLVDAQGKDVASFGVEQSGEDKGKVRLSILPAAKGRGLVEIEATPAGSAGITVGRTIGPRTDITSSPKSSGVTVWGENRLEFTTAK